METADVPLDFEEDLAIGRFEYLLCVFSMLSVIIYLHDPHQLVSTRAG